MQSYNFFSIFACNMSHKFIILTTLLLLVTLAWGQETGRASYYSRKLEGNRVSDGSRYHPDSLICAHRTLPFGTLLWVKNKKNGLDVVVKVSDRGPHVRGRIIDLSWRAAKEIGMLLEGIAEVEIQVIDNWPVPIRRLVIPSYHIPVRDSIKIPELIHY